MSESREVHVVIDHVSVRRARETGHPRLLRNLLDGNLRNGLMAGVSIVRLTVRDEVFEYGREEVE